jgi:hypothetical protein
MNFTQDELRRVKSDDQRRRRDDCQCGCHQPTVCQSIRGFVLLSARKKGPWSLGETDSKAVEVQVCRSPREG